ncbi:hypothetical protein [Paraburkholderia sp. 35.1]|uniref:hypothetical protein n=1 Tax=Paraburkholderia sp. 35.1 TaxID=2991058 RepID=UPI003D225329
MILLQRENDAFEIVAWEFQSYAKSEVLTLWMPPILLHGRVWQFLSWEIRACREKATRKMVRTRLRDGL